MFVQARNKNILKKEKPDKVVVTRNDKYFNTSIEWLNNFNIIRNNIRSINKNVNEL